ncbi:hypothetical protein MJO28_014119, partial [Puccinia striiformis f. sp. tritici]
PNPSLKNAEPTGWVGSALIQHSRIHGRRIPAVSTAGDQTVATAGPKPLIPRPRLQKAFRKGDFDVSVASTATSTLVVGEFICSAKAALNSQVIKGLLIQTKEPGTRDLSQKPDLSHKQIVLPVNPFMSCVLAIEPILSGSIDPVFLPWKSSQVWCLFLKKAATILAQDVMFFRIFIVGLICQIVRAQSQYEYMRVFPNEKNTVVQYSESVPEDLSSDRIKRRVFDTQKLYSALGQDGADIKEVLEQKACHNPKSTSDEYYLVADAATVAQGTHWATADHARVSLTINKDLSAKMNDVIGKMIP